MPSPASTTRLTLAQLAGQRIIYAYAGLHPPPSLLARIRTGEAAGVIFFAPNISSPAQLRGVVGQFQKANVASPVHVPLLMITDQEGGLVNRLPGPPLLSEKAIGASPNGLDLARQAGAAAGTNLIASGITVDLAPVLDVYRPPGNFIDQYQRSYSMNPTQVSRLGQSFIRTLQKTGVAATAKHFPGLGAATRVQNTDVGPTELDLPLDEIREIDEAPYRAAISSGVKLIMLSWAVYPAIDARMPAGLSSRVIDKELRRRLGFRGVTITDSIGAGALTPFGGYAQRGVLAVRAGDDLIICATTDPNANTPNEGVAVLKGIVGALVSHKISRIAAEQAADKVIALRASP